MARNSNSALRILQEKELKRRLVPPVIIRRRMNIHRGLADPGVEVLNTAKRYSARHAKTLSNLIIRSMGLVQTPDAVKRKFERDGLDDIKADPRAAALINNAVNKISEILVFKMVASELVNDKVLCDRLVNLFINQRFDAIAKVQQEPVTQPSASLHERRLQEQHEALMGLVHTIMDS